MYRVRRDLTLLIFFMLIFRYVILSLGSGSPAQLPQGDSARILQAIYAAVVLVGITSVWRESWVGKLSILSLSWGFRSSLHVSSFLGRMF